MFLKYFAFYGVYVHVYMHVPREQFHFIVGNAMHLH